MKVTRSGVVAVLIAAAFFTGSVVALAVAGGEGNGAETAAKKKKKKKKPQVKTGPAGPAGAAGRDLTATSIDYVAAPPSGPTVIFNGNGLVLSASCAAGPDSLYATTGAGSIEVKWTTFTSATDGGNTSGGESDSYTRFPTAGVADLFLSDDAVADGTLVYDANGRDTGGGQITVIDFHAEEANGVCRFAGSARPSA